MSNRDGASFEGLSIRAAVFLGFGLVVGLWLFAWFQLSGRIQQAQTKAAEINTRYTAAQQVLADVRTQVLTASVVLRDVLLDSKGRNVDADRHQLEKIYSSIDALLRGYQPMSNSEAERSQFDRLRSEVNAFRASMLEILSSDPAEWRREAVRLIRLRVTPRRDIVIGIAEGAQAVNRAAYVQQQLETADIYRSMQRELWQLLGLALAISAAVAVLAVMYSDRLERRIREQLRKDFKLTRELESLSAKLVTAQEEERRLIARELHDEVGQALTAVKVELAHAQKAIDESRGPTQMLVHARSITDGALNQVRDLSYLLHPAALDELGLVAALQTHVDRFSNRQGIEVRLIHSGLGTRLGPEIETAAYRIVQEGLTNVAKHSHATKCQIHLTHAGETLKITIEDDGVGFGPKGVTGPKGLGLIGIRERAFHLHGTARFENVYSGGVRIVVELPAPGRGAVEDFTPVPDPTAA